MDIKKFVWTVEKESFLINLIRTRPALWNPADENFNKKTIKKVIYDQVGQEMGKRWPEDASSFTATFLHLKFATLRSYFHKEDKKRMASEGTGFEFMPKWVHYQQLYFLKPSAGLSESTLDLSVEEESQPSFVNSEDQPDTFENGSLPLLSEVTCTFKEEPSSSEVESTPALPFNREPPIKRKRKSQGHEILSLATSALENLQNRRDNDSTSMPSVLGHLVQTTLRNLSPEDSSAFTHDLLILIAKYAKDPQKLNCSR